MKTRIKVVLDGNGANKYYPQVKGLFFWRGIKEWRHSDWRDIKTYALHHAQLEIDQYIKSMNSRMAEKTEYIKYP